MLPSISVIIPVYNSQESLPELYQRLVDILEPLGNKYEIIMVDDASADRSFEVMVSLREQDKGLNIIRLARNHGQHMATLCGLKQSRGDLLITIDDDLQYPPEVIPDLLEMMKKGYEVVFAVPKRKKQALYRNLGSRAIQYILHWLFGRPAGVETSSYRVLTRELVDKILEEPGPGIFLAALIFQHTRNAAELKIVQADRKYGHSNYNLLRSIKLAGQLCYVHLGRKHKQIQALDFDIAEIWAEEGGIL